MRTVLRPHRKLARARNSYNQRLLMVDNFNCPTGLPDSFYWVTVDTENKITLVNGNISFSGGRAAPGWGDPSDVSRAPHLWTRQAGLTIEWQVTPGAANKELLVGFTDGSLATNAAEAHGIYFKDTGNLSVILNAATGTVVPLAYTAVSTWARIVCMVQPDGTVKGARYEVSTDEKVTWKLVWIDTTVTTATLYAFVESYDAALTASKVEVRQGSVKDAVLSASPGAPALVAGDELITDGDMEAVGVASWPNYGTPTTKEKSAAQAHGGSQSLHVIGDAQFDGVKSATYTTVTGGWYLRYVWIKVASGSIYPTWRKGDNSGNSAIGGAVTAGDWAQRLFVTRETAGGASAYCYMQEALAEASEWYLDDVSDKPLPFDQTGVLEYIGDAGVKLGVAKANITVAAGYHAGFVVCADSATAPTNSIWTYYDRTLGKAYLMNNATELVASSVAYSAAAEQRVVIIGPVAAAYIGLYYGGVLQGAIQGPYDLSAYGTHCHAFQTGSSTVANFTFDTGVGA